MAAFKSDSCTQFPSSKEQQFYKFYARLKGLLQFFITFIKITISLFVFPLNKLKLVALNMLRVVSIAWKENVMEMALHI